MAAAHHTPGDQRTVRDQTAFPYLAVFATFGAALAFAGVGTVTRQLGGNPVGMVAGAIVMALAGVFLLAPAARGWALLLGWNGLGIAVGLLVIGIFSVGALMIFPLALIAIALTSWPLAEGESVVSWPAIGAQVGGFFLVLALYGVLHLVAGDVTGLAGG